MDVITNTDTTQLIYKYNAFVRYAVAVMGLLANTFMFVVYFQPGLRKLSVSIYFRCMALFCALQNLHNLFIIDDLFALIDNSDLMCKLVSFLLILFSPMAAWFELTAGLDRFVTIVFLPARFKWIEKTCTQCLIVAGVVVYNMAFYSKILFSNYLIEYDTDDYAYTVCEDSFGDGGLEIVDFANNSAVPFVIMLVTSVATFAGVIRARARIKHVGHNDTAINSQQARRRVRRDIRFGVTMLAMNFAFFLFNFPYRLNYVVDWMSQIVGDEDDFAFFVFQVILIDAYDMYYSMNFFVKLAVNSLVRRECVKLVTNVFAKIRGLFGV